MKPRQLLAAAGLGHLPYRPVIGGFATVLIGLSLSLVRITGVLGVGLAGLVLGAAATLEVLLTVARSREAALVAGLPEVAESLASGIASGQPLDQCLQVLADVGPKSLKPSFREFNRITEGGATPEAALSWLQVELSNGYADQLIRLLLVSLRVGGNGLVSSLNRLASEVRSQAALDGEINAKQGWVSGTAKLAVIAPWLILLFLNQRPEAHAFYNSPAGFGLLSAGLLVCLTAYALIQLMSGLPKPKRVLGNG